MKISNYVARAGVAGCEFKTANAITQCVLQCVLALEGLGTRYKDFFESTNKFV